MINPIRAGRRAAWTRVGLVLAAVALLPLAGCGKKLAACDSPALQAALKSAIEAKTGAKIASATNVKTVSADPNHAMCSVHMTLTDQTSADISYSLDFDPKDGSTNFKVVGVQ